MSNNFFSESQIDLGINRFITHYLEVSMKQNPFKWLWVLLIPLLFAACSGSTPEPAAVADFQLAAGKLQLVEFYADW